MTQRNAINPPPLPKTVKTPPVSAEARSIMDEGPEFEAFRKRLEDHINANTPTWRKVLYNLRQAWQERKK